MDSLNKRTLGKNKNKVVLVILLFVIVLIVGVFSLYVIKGCKEKKESDINMDNTEVSSIDLPWENSEKKPSEYTIEEFEKLTDIQQELFYEWFDSSDDFEKWMNDAKRQNETKEIVVPWKSGGKEPSEYTMKEFEELTNVQQELFFEWFDSVEDFEKWYSEANANDIKK